MVLFICMSLCISFVANLITIISISFVSQLLQQMKDHCAKLKIRKSFFFFIAALSHFTFGQETFRINLKLIFCSFSLLFEPCGDRNNETWAERKVAVFRKCNGIFKPMG